MRVLMVHNRYRSSQPSGENISVDTESRLLAERGCEVVRLELESDAIAQWPWHKRITLPIRAVWSSHARRLTEDAIQRQQPDVIHFQNTFPLFSPAALWSAKGAGVRVVASLRNFRPLCISGDLLRNQTICEKCVGHSPVSGVIHGCYRDSRLASLPVATMNLLHHKLGTWERCVDVFVVPSSFTRSKYIEAGWPGERMVVKYNTTAARPWPRHKRPRGFVCVSRLSREKGIDVLLEAWHHAFPDGGEGLQIVGSGEHEKALKVVAAPIEGVRFRGQLSMGDVMQLLAECRAAVIPSLWYEPFGRVTVEAFSAGTPVIASRIGALPEIVRGGENGILVEPGTPSQLAQALESLAGSDRLTQELGRRARSDYEARFAPSVTTAKLLSIYGYPVSEGTALSHSAFPVELTASDHQ